MWPWSLQVKKKLLQFASNEGDAASVPALLARGDVDVDTRDEVHLVLVSDTRSVVLTLQYTVYVRMPRRHSTWRYPTAMCRLQRHSCRPTRAAMQPTR
jgi:hypothetical protein